MGLACDPSQKLAAKPAEDGDQREMVESFRQKMSCHVGSQVFARRMGKQKVESFVVVAAAKNGNRAAAPEEGKAQLDKRSLKKQATRGPCV